jgi:chorismate synthase
MQLLLFLSPFNEGKLGATLSSSLDGNLSGASSGVTACVVVEVRLGSSIAEEEGGRNNDSVQHDVLSSSQQQ